MVEMVGFESGSDNHARVPADSGLKRSVSGTDQNRVIHLYTHERACPEARSARGRTVRSRKGAPAPGG